MTDYPDLPNPDLLSRIPLSARIVLDVGCGAGALGAAFRRRSPRTRLLGIEQNRAAAQVAAQRLDMVANVDVEQTPLPFGGVGAIDCIVYGDALEHMKDPWAVLRAHQEALSPTGIILISIPNVEHWSFVARLLRGDWDYEETGLFDRTHLRWFSLETMRKGLEALGLAPIDVHPRVFDPARVDGFVAAMTPTLRLMGIDPASYKQRAAPLQYVWRAATKPARPLMVAANMLPPVGGVSHTRIVFPLEAIATQPGVQTHLIGEGELPGFAQDTPRILVLHRPILSGSAGRQQIERLIASGWVIVTEFDDHPDFLPAMHNAETFSFTGVHAVQTSTEMLGGVLRQRNPEVRVFANAMRELPEPRNFRDPGKLTVFFGALNREMDWQPFMPVLNDIAARAGERLRFAVVHDRGFFDALDSPHKSFTPTADYETYLRVLGGSEICFMPLADTPFNRAKSDLKFVEAGACRVAALASPTVYEASIEDGRTGLIFRDPQGLRERLLRLIAMPDLPLTLGEAARTYVAQHRMLAYQVADRIAWYRSLWERRDELTAALRQRIGD